MFNKRKNKGIFIWLKSSTESRRIALFSILSKLPHSVI